MSDENRQENSVLGVKEFSLLAMLMMMIMGLAGPCASRLYDKWERMGMYRLEFAEKCAKKGEHTPEQCIKAANEIRF